MDSRIERFKDSKNKTPDLKSVNRDSSELLNLFNYSRQFRYF